MMFAAVAALSLSASAEVFEYVDHWPSGEGEETATEVLVTNVTAVIATADDAARVERLTKLEIGLGATVTYTASTDLNLAADVFGAGNFDATSAGQLTLSGNNADFASPGRFSFSDTVVVVNHADGLGSRTTGQALFGGSDSTKSKIIFNIGSSGVYTNEVAMKFTYAPYVLYANPQTGRIVQHNTINKTVGGNLNVAGTLEFYDCHVQSAAYLYLSKPSDATTSHIWFGPKCTYSLSWKSFIYVPAHFAGASNFNSYPSLNTTGYCEGVDVIKDTMVDFWSAGVLDLQGYDQKMKGFSYYGSNRRSVITSKKPAILTTTSAQTITHQPQFTEAAGYCHDHTGTETITTILSTSTNILEVKKGKVILTNGAGWSGDVTVRADATLELSSDKAMQGGDRKLTVETDGNLIIKAGAQCYVASANIAGTELEPDSYTVAKLRDEMDLPVDGDDLAILTVKDTSEWKGWPTSGTAKVPTGTTVYIGDDDVAKVMGLDQIKLMPNSSVICTNAENILNLTAKVTGVGTFGAKDAAPIILNGDNSGLQSPGTFFFTNTYVTVSNRYGLGSTGTAEVRFCPGDKTSDLSLRFGGEGLICDAPLAFGNSETAGNAGVFGSDTDDEMVVISNSFIVVGWRPNIYFKNNVYFDNGNFRIRGTGSGNNYLYSKSYGKGADVADVWFGAGSRPAMVYWFAYQCRYHWGWKQSGGYFGLFVNYNDKPVVICEAEDVLKVPYAITEGAFDGWYDINGYNQEVLNLSKEYNGNNNPFIITSAVLAVVRQTGVSTTANLCNLPMQFRGAAGYSHAAACTNDFFKYYSDTTAPLTIEKGGIRLRDGAGWGGTNVTVKTGAVLIVDSTSPNAFKKATSPSRTHLAVESGGTLRLESSETPVQVKSFTYAGVAQKPGTYTAADNVGLEGPGTLKVRRYPWDRGMLILFR